MREGMILTKIETIYGNCMRAVMDTKVFSKLR